MTVISPIPWPAVSEQYKFYQLLKIIAAGTGALLNASEIGNTIGLSPDTVREYIHILRKSFIIATVPPFHSNVRKELTKMPKAYLFDSGFRNTVLGEYRHPEERLDKGARSAGCNALKREGDDR